MVPIIKLKKRVPYTSMFRVIITKFRHEQKLCLFVFFVIKEGFKLSIYHTILPLSLAFSLGVEGSRKSSFDA